MTFFRTTMAPLARDPLSSRETRMSVSTRSIPVLVALLIGISASAQVPTAGPPRHAYPPIKPIPNLPWKPFDPRAPRDPMLAYRKDQLQRLPLPVFAKVFAPKNAKVIFFGPTGETLPFAAPVAVGLKTRHRYYFAVEGLSPSPATRYYGTIEVLSTVHPPVGVRLSDAPVPIPLTDEDGDRLAKERLLTKIIVLEDAEKALALPQVEQSPICYDVPGEEDPIRFAKDVGKMMIVIRMGSRVPTTDEIAGEYVSGSLQIPRREIVVGPSGKKYRVTRDWVDAELLASKGRVQQMSFTGHNSSATSCPPGAVVSGCCEVGPLANYLPAEDADAEEGYLCDGGDFRPRAGFNIEGTFVNVDASETVAVYDNQQQKKIIVPTNRVCIFAPRFVEVRHQLLVELVDRRQLVSAVELDEPIVAIDQTVRDLADISTKGPQSVKKRDRANGLVMEESVSDFGEIRVLSGYDKLLVWTKLFNVDTPSDVHVTDRAEMLARIDIAHQLTLDTFPQVVAMTAGASEVKALWTPEESVHYDPKKYRPGNLVIEKIASTSSAKLGEEITFTIRYMNNGEQVIRNLAVVDSLTARLEYVPESATSSLEAIFTTEANEVSSDKLRWEIKPELKPGESGIVQFRAKVR